MNLLERLTLAYKAFTMRFPGGQQAWGSMFFGGPGRFDYDKEVGDGASSSLVTATVGWLTRTFPDSRVVLQQDTPDGPKDVFLAPVVELLSRPNPFYSGDHLWGATVADYNTSGNAYWLKLRSGTRKVVQLWWCPSTLIEPKWPDSGLEYVSHYEYKPDGVTPYAVDPGDVVHFRNGFDPDNPRKGNNVLKSLTREIYTDIEASQFTAAILRNLGVPGVMVSPDDDAEMGQEDADKLKEMFKYRFSGERRGEPIVMSSKTKVSVLSFTPAQMDLRQLRMIPEERVTARIGVSPMVIGLGAGLAHSTYNNYEEARLAAYESNILPTQRLFGSELDTQLLPDFVVDTSHHLRWDNSGVRVLQDDETAKVDRAMKKLAGGAVTLDEARLAMGHPEAENGSGKVYYIPIAVEVTPEDQLAVTPPELPAPTPINVLPPPEAASRRRGVELKRAVRGTIRGVRRVRRRVEPAATRAVVKYLTACRDRVVAEIEDSKNWHAVQALGTTNSTNTVLQFKVADPLDVDRERDELEKALNPYYIRVLGGVHDVVTSAFDVDFELDDPLTRAYLNRAGTRINGITDTTLKQVRLALQEGQAAGEGQSTLANRIRELPAFDKPRANTVARTEMGHASNQAAFTNYRASGVVAGVEVDDGDSDEECEAMNGRRFSMDELDNVETLAHPNCVRAFLPLTDNADLEDRRGAVGEDFGE